MIVDLVKDPGSESYIYIHAKPGVDLVARSWSRAREAGRHGSAARKNPDGVVHLFNPETGERIG